MSLQRSSSNMASCLVSVIAIGALLALGAGIACAFFWLLRAAVVGAQ